MHRPLLAALLALTACSTTPAAKTNPPLPPKPLTLAQPAPCRAVFGEYILHHEYKAGSCPEDMVTGDDTLFVLPTGILSIGGTDCPYSLSSSCLLEATCPSLPDGTTIRTKLAPHPSGAGLAGLTLITTPTCTLLLQELAPRLHQRTPSETSQAVQP